MKIYLFFLVTFSCLVASEEGQVIQVQAIGVGATESEAVTDAQRNALKLSYQTFISSDLSVLNDQIEKDEIVSLVSGTIEDFKVLSTFEDDYGLWEANIDATLTQDSLVRFAQAIGDAVKVQGSLFGAEIKQQNLNKKSELVSIKHLIKKAGFFDDFFDASIEVGEPKYIKDDQYSITVNLSLTANDNLNQLFQVVFDTLKAVEMDDIEVEKYFGMGRPLYRMTVCNNSSARAKYRSNIYRRLELVRVPRPKPRKRRRNSDSPKTDSPQTTCETFSLRHLESVRLLTGHNPNVSDDVWCPDLSHGFGKGRKRVDNEGYFSTKEDNWRNERPGKYLAVNRADPHLNSFNLHEAYLGLEGLIVNNLLNYPVKRMTSTNVCPILMRRDTSDGKFKRVNFAIQPYNPSLRVEGGLTFIAMQEAIQRCDFADGVLLNACHSKNNKRTPPSSLGGQYDRDRAGKTVFKPGRCERNWTMVNEGGDISYCVECTGGSLYNPQDQLTNVLLFPAKGDFITSFYFTDQVSTDELSSITGYEVLTSSEAERIFKRAEKPNNPNLSSCSW